MPLVSVESTHVLRDPQYQRLWALGTAVGLIRWVEVLAYAVFTYEQTESALWVASLMMLRMLPLAFLLDQEFLEGFQALAVLHSLFQSLSTLRLQGLHLRLLRLRSSPQFLTKGCLGLQVQHRIAVLRRVHPV